MARIRVLSPVGPVAREAFAVPRLPDALAGRTVGFLDNSKHNFDRLADAMGALLQERHGVRAVVRRRKPNAAVGAPPAVLAELAKTCDVVFAGSAD